jgi:pimeloyl-ACP methyl ester carboxylesterase
MSTKPNIVLVHGAWADGSSWSAVVERLQADGYHVTAPQFPETSLADDVARLRQVLDRQDGPTVVAAHSYGGQIMTALGTDAPNAVALVYIAAFGLDQGESIGGLLAQGPITPALAHLDIDKQGFAWIPEDDFVNHFAADVDPVKARVMFAVQQALAASTLEDVMGVPAWKSLPTWFLVADGDQAIPPDAERQFAARMGATTVEVATNHVAMVSHPDDVSSSSRRPPRRSRREPSQGGDTQLGGEGRVVPQDPLRPDPPPLETHDRDGEHLSSPPRRGDPRQQPGQLLVVGERHRRLVDQVEAVHGPGPPGKDQVGGHVGEQRLGVEPLKGLAPGGTGHSGEVPDRRLARQLRQRRRQVAADERGFPVLVPHPLQLPHELCDRGGHLPPSVRGPRRAGCGRSLYLSPTVPGWRAEPGAAAGPRSGPWRRRSWR